MEEQPTKKCGLVSTSRFDEKSLEKHGDNFNAIHNDKSLRLLNVPLYNMKRAFKRHDAKIRAKMKTRPQDYEFESFG